jgi:hypothetical protein
MLSREFRTQRLVHRLGQWKVKKTVMFIILTDICLLWNTQELS